MIRIVFPDDPGRKVKRSGSKSDSTRIIKGDDKKKKSWTTDGVGFTGLIRIQSHTGGALRRGNSAALKLVQKCLRVS